MSTVIAEVRTPRAPITPPVVTRRRKRRSRRDRVEAGIILAAFALALAFTGNQQSGQSVSLSWSPVQDTAVNQTLQVGAWLPLGLAVNLTDDAIYRFCVTTQGAGTMLMVPSQLAGTVTLAGGAPVTTCADTNELRDVDSVRPSVTVADPASEITVLETSWQRLETDGA
ncbi:hypothetical protein [Demequina aurantiaca]|uniref:hypothetical protein n=1 Tax=Demequina aurantiaca TaxID=676200 RepID=UPI003D3404C3